MIDMFALLVSSGMIAIVVFFAIRLNRERAWFEPPQKARKPGRPTDGAAAWRAAARGIFRR